jgi:ABC-type transport system involved in multi-copper enzyme maturation permease subunit
MLVLHNILSVAKYESKLLVRSWFFKVFSTIAVLVAFGYSLGTLSDAGSPTWLLRAIPSTIPYGTLILLNAAQAVIAIFLSSEFIKRDKQLDTSEVFYVRPLSNAEYVIGKTWGNLRVFLGLNLVILLIALLFNLTASNTYVDWSSYLVYFLLISVPTLLFIMGMSFCAMLLLNNQALTFVVMLGYVGLTLFVIGELVYHLFDYMAFSLPMFRSTIVGFSGMEEILVHRGMYLAAGIGFICLTIYLFKRLPHAPQRRFWWLLVSLVFLMGSVFLGFRYVQRYASDLEHRQALIELNDQYGGLPVMSVLEYKMDVEQLSDGIHVRSRMLARALDSARVFVFTLNPYLDIISVNAPQEQVQMKREQQIVLLEFGREIPRGDTLMLEMEYRGGIDQLLCFLDIPEKNLLDKNRDNNINFAKRYAFHKPNYLLLTPESFWYPRPGTAFSTRYTGWQQSFFSHFDVSVKPLPGLVPVSQGKVDTLSDGRIHFLPEAPLTGLSLSIGQYDKLSFRIDSVDMEYAVYYFKGHDFFTRGLDSIKKEIPGIIHERRLSLERDLKLTYPFRRFTLVEVPGQFAAYARSWTQAQEWTQPEMVFIPEMAYAMRDAEFEQQVKMRSRFMREQRSLQDRQRDVLNNFLFNFQRINGRPNFQRSRGQTSIQQTPNPWYQFPQFYDFTFNLYSIRWPVANRLVASYLQNTNSGVNQYQRSLSGMSPDEEASVLLQEHPLSRLLADTAYRDRVSGVVSLKARQLFAYGELLKGEEDFRTVVSNIVKGKPFQNVRFESFLGELRDSTGVDILDRMDAWFNVIQVPRYIIGIPRATRVRNAQETRFEVVEQITNSSDVEGIVKISLQYSGGWSDSETSLMYLAPGQTKEIVMVSETDPRSMVIQTLVSLNLPGYVEHTFSQVERQQRRVRDTGQFVVQNSALYVPEGEIVVDNEDEDLFTVTTPDVTGLLQTWMQKADDKKSKYSGYSYWRAPIRWTLVTNSGYYGQYVRSAHIIRPGNGSQVATWRVPLKERGRYDVYYYAYREQEGRRFGGGPGGQGGRGGFGGRGQRGEYNLRIRQGATLNEPASIEFWGSAGWVLVGTYILEADTAYVDLTNKAEMNMNIVAADAVKFVKR